MAAAEAVTNAISEEDALRAQLYRLLALYLQSPPAQAELDLAAQLEGDDSPIGKGISTLALIAGKSEETAIGQEYQDLFIGLGRGELLPYASYYLTGFLNEKPLAKLRNTMSELGMKRQEGVKEPEDHAGALCEMMAGLVEGDFGDGSLEGQRKFFNDHLSAWIRHFFTDLENAKSSVFYAALGTIGKSFMEIEEAAFEMS